MFPFLESSQICTQQCFLAVSAVLMNEDGSLVSRILAVKQWANVLHTAVNIKNELQTILTSYGIAVENFRKTFVTDYSKSLKLVCRYIKNCDLI